MTRPDLIHAAKTADDCPITRIMVPRFRLPCGHTFSTRKAAKRHYESKECWNDPRSQCCKTCKHFSRDVEEDDHAAGYAGQTISLCAADVIGTADWHPPEKADYINIHCPKWEGGHS